MLEHEMCILSFISFNSLYLSCEIYCENFIDFFNDIYCENMFEILNGKILENSLKIFFYSSNNFSPIS